jgi:hypothetical protein
VTLPTGSGRPDLRLQTERGLARRGFLAALGPVLASLLIGLADLGVVWTLILLWLVGTAALVAGILVRSRKLGQPPSLSLLFERRDARRRPDRSR